ncbi:aspartic peptidase domain-containing protein [Rhexocercosporidium sp. MPI-PUGE-AT-0058]|nr:aspartic peptidase domain-containing protein [Rhexocercosporidium sp. MPI-PUGE-AT-0058]
MYLPNLVLPKMVGLLLMPALSTVVAIPSALPPIHYTISRRSGSFPAPDTANLTHLLEELKVLETRFNATTRDFNGNKVVRKPKRIRGTQGNTILLGEVGRQGNWFADLKMGEPAQTVNMDLDMLTADWWVFSTSSSKGSWFLDFNSKTYGPTDVVHLPTTETPIPITFAHCRPAKQWLRALLPSGAYLGLAPSPSLSQTKTVGLLQQLMEKKAIDVPVWSLLLINGKDGIFSIGGTSAPSVRQAEKETEEMLNPGEHDETKRDTAQAYAKDNWKELKWMKVHGAEGWWQILMRGIWVDGIKVLDNQPIILDVNTPFIVAPPLAARSFYSSISGSRQLSPPYDQFHAYPCFNPPKIHFEFEQWNVQVLKGSRDKGTFSPGGRFSLGRMASGSGYCIGIVVESRMGVSTALNGGETGSSVSIDGGNGLADVWIIGEPFFRDVQVAFNWKEKKVGMQRA